jgi:4-hydroxyphenylacetate 3-monooxygenase
MKLELYLVSEGPMTVELDSLVVAGFTGRDAEAVRRHVDELASEGIPAPERVPEFYVLPVELLTTGEEIAVDGGSTSGEVEPIVFVTNDGMFVGVGSDHTDRERERESIALAKGACPKIVARDVVPYDAVAERWDDLVVRSTVDGGELYQHAPLSELLPVAVILEGLRERVPGTGNAAIFCGTVPLQNGFRFSDRFSGELVDSDGTVLASYSYGVTRRTDEDR